MNHPDSHQNFKLLPNLILHKGRIWLPQGFPIIPTLLTEYHSTPTRGHMGVAMTIARLSKNFHWPGMRTDVTQFVASCIDCQHTKYETKWLAELLCPLSVPHRPWEDLSLDFIVGLPPYRGHTIILVVVDRFSKGILLGMLPSSHTAHMVASLFMDIVAKLHGPPRSLVSNRDPLFLSHFWQELFHLSGTQLRMSSTYHPQSDGQTEVLNKVVEQYLWVFVHQRPTIWGKLLPWVEWFHNSAWNTATGTTPYEITFGRKPFNFPEYLTGASTIDAANDLLINREFTFTFICKKLLKAQEAMKKQADSKHREAYYQIGDWVMLKLRPHRQSSARGSQAHAVKLAKRFYGPFSGPWPGWNSCLSLISSGRGTYSPSFPLFPAEAIQRPTSTRGNNPVTTWLHQRPVHHNSSSNPWSTTNFYHRGLLVGSFGAMARYFPIWDIMGRLVNIVYWLPPWGQGGPARAMGDSKTQSMINQIPSKNTRVQITNQTDQMTSRDTREVQIESRGKRRITKPTYLMD